MFNARARYALMAGFGLSVAVCLFYKQYELAAAAGFFMGFVFWSHIKQGSVLQASKFFKNGDHDKAAALLAETGNPDRLAPNRRGYYEFMLGNIALKKERFEAAETHFQIASRFPVGGKNDKAFVLIHLANLALRRKDRERTTAYVSRARELAVTERAKDIIEQIERQVQKLPPAAKAGGPAGADN
ncbi:hypothetical protein C7T94_07250 [Pedobacter yulinensis]|uniref:Tetratricopeptide repeat protein n=1 Tax=Pedobacter yulinensis TaxID=2126353 RepID=A0A2T3HPV1_9SPHI|nr:hypothetical protein [Pedobacter yulinensis]PST84488.1 hypothetical protein C7T94_07250 [Pedobacter yulinensis]